MSARSYESVEFGEDLPEVEPDVGMENVKRFCRSAMMYGPRFTDHEKAKKEGLEPREVRRATARRVAVV